MKWYQVCACYSEVHNGQEEPEVATFYFRSEKDLDELMENKFLIEAIMNEVSIIIPDVHVIFTQLPIEELLGIEGNDEVLVSPDGEKILLRKE